LSKGEKNIIAFLYFILALEKADNDTRPKIVVLDDPMTSNDDTMQYLMINEIQQFYRKLSDGNYLLILTHNCHFYLNVRPNTSQTYKENNGQEISHYGKFGNYHMISDGKHTTINKIEKGKQDFLTNYEMLWRELIFLFDSNEPNLMLNVCRKICETYMHFTKKGVESFYGDNISAKKLFDVNQHSIDDLEAEQNGKTKEEIKNILTELFKMNNAKEHFESHFKRG
jgi:wobble nucleotide-excising tRNase